MAQNITDNLYIYIYSLSHVLEPLKTGKLIFL